MMMKHPSTINKNSLLSPSKLPYFLLIALFTFIAHFPLETQSYFTPHFVWSAVNKTLEEDRLTIVDTNNEKLKIKSCTKVVLFNNGSEEYVTGNDSKTFIHTKAILVDVTSLNFATWNVLQEVESRINETNPGTCVPCIVVVSLVNVDAMEGALYKNKPIDQLIQDEKQIQDYKLNLSMQFTQLLQFKTPIQARHLVLVRLVKTKEELTKCHGKKYTKYPRRLVSIWEQVLFDHFKEARVIQGATASGNSETILTSGKESGIWVWMCEEIIRRLDLLDRCKQHEEPEHKCQEWEKNNSLSTAENVVKMRDRQQCGVYRPRT
ncbi:unnamed protein product [Orchesella dallaii]|uniref:Uncharacterized protein n=1 Tax=Orchesella dallaii TaxID=48710 RepID=A0ABP1PNS7_9HEXA